eukprot:3859344-Rhodomonas_salina.2
MVPSLAVCGAVEVVLFTCPAQAQAKLFVGQVYANTMAIKITHFANATERDQSPRICEGHRQDHRTKREVELGAQRVEQHVDLLSAPRQTSVSKWARIRHALSEFQGQDEWHDTAPEG